MSSSFICEKCGSSSYEQMTYTQARCLQCEWLNVFDSGYKGQREFQLSPDINLLDLAEKTNYENAPLIKRFVNYLADVMFMVIAITIISSLTNLENMAAGISIENIYRIAALILLPFYYIFMEYKFGKTVGKFFTRTRVVSADGSPLTFKQCLLRAACRFIPFESISGFISNGIFWHDSLAKTMVIED